MLTSPCAAAVAQVGDLPHHRKRSKTIKRTLNPRWNQEFEFWPLDQVGEPRARGWRGAELLTACAPPPRVRQLGTTILDIKVFDWDRCGSDDFLGEVQVDFGASVRHASAHREAAADARAQGR